MRKYIITALLVGAFAALPMTALAAAQAKGAAKGAAKVAPAPAATHATSGTIKSINDTALVIARAGKRAEDMTFTLNADTKREGTVAVGSSVSVRYRDEGKTHVATAIAVQQPKAKK